MHRCYLTRQTRQQCHQYHLDGLVSRTLLPHEKSSKDSAARHLSTGSHRAFRDCFLPTGCLLVVALAQTDPALDGPPKRGDDAMIARSPTGARQERGVPFQNQLHSTQWHAYAGSD